MKKIAFILFLIIPFLCFSEVLEIQSFLSSDKDPAYKQFKEDVRNYRMAAASLEKSLPPVNFYSYKIKAGDDFFKVASYLEGWKGMIVSLNNFSKFNDMNVGDVILIASQPGFFFYEDKASDLSIFLDNQELQKLYSEDVSFVDEDNKVVNLKFYPNMRLNSTQMNYFLDDQMIFPLDVKRITSPFGVRSDPFTGKKSYHRGIDLGSPENSNVYCVMGGTIIEKGFSRVYGNYLIIDHGNNLRTLYGHMNKTFFKKGDKVHQKDIIGLVGSTGMSTGPHLHFEIFRKGENVDPLKLVKM